MFVDVIFVCDKVFEMVIDDLFVKIIIVIEKLYVYVYEWYEGGWVMVVNKVVVLYEKLWDMICDWRRLELLFWLWLLDVEVKKMYDVVKVFWFDVYNDVIFKLCVFFEEGLFKEYVVEFLEIFLMYFIGDCCIVG